MTLFETHFGLQLREDRVARVITDPLIKHKGVWFNNNQTPLEEILQYLTYYYYFGGYATCFGGDFNHIRSGRKRCKV